VHQIFEKCRKYRDLSIVLNHGSVGSSSNPGFSRNALRLLVNFDIVSFFVNSRTLGNRSRRIVSRLRSGHRVNPGSYVPAHKGGTSVGSPSSSASDGGVSIAVSDAVVTSTTVTALVSFLLMNPGSGEAHAKSTHWSPITARMPLASSRMVCRRDKDHS
jgi:hypothetical protein